MPINLEHVIIVPLHKILFCQLVLGKMYHQSSTNAVHSDVSGASAEQGHFIEERRLTKTVETSSWGFPIAVS